MNYTTIKRKFKEKFSDILRGSLIKNLQIERYFVHIIYTFFLFMMAIWISLTIETSMAKLEKGKKEITELEIANAQKKYELAKAERRTNVITRLQDMGSKVAEPEHPASIIKKK